MNAPSAAWCMFCAKTCDARAARRVDHRLQRRERRADRDVDAVDRRHPRQQRRDELLAPPRRSCASSSCRRSAACGSSSSRAPPRRAACLPSSSSSEAPPPVERWVTAVGEPELGQRRRRVAAADDGRRRARGDRLGDRARPAANGSSSNAPIGPFQNTVPACGDLARRRSAVRGPMSRPIQPSGTSTPSSSRALGVGGEAVGRAPGRWAASQPVRPAAGERAPRRLDVLGLAQRIADRVALRARGTESTSRRRSASCRRARRKRLDHADLVGHLGAADDGDERRAGILEDPA